MLPPGLLQACLLACLLASVLAAAGTALAAQGESGEGRTVAAWPAPSPAIRLPDPAERLRILETMERRAPAALESDKSRDALDNYDLRHIRLEIDITDTLGQVISGVTTQRIESRVAQLSMVAFDLDATMEVDSVFVDGQVMSFQHTDQLARVFLETPLPAGGQADVRVFYHGQVNPGGIGIRFQKNDGKAFVWTLSEPSDGRYWWPCKDRPDDKADSSDVLITAPAWMTATSNGLLQTVTNGPGTRTWWWHESYPIVPYLVSLSAGDYVRLVDSYPVPGQPPMLLEHFAFPDQQAAAAEDFSIAAEAVGAYAGRFGQYPFVREKYGVSMFGWGGAMEHQTNTSYSLWLVRGDHYFDYIYVHELSHQWWGDNVTCATWADCWLNEGFASWCEAIWMESRGGLPAYLQYMDSVQVVSDPSGPLYNYPNPFDGNTIYNKGAWVVHMLRGVLGDQAFFAGLADYRALYEGRSVTTQQFREVVETSAGRDLGWYFDEWVYGTNRPTYRVSTFSEPNGPRQRVWVHLEQVQANTGRFTMPVRITAQSGIGHAETVLWNDRSHEDLALDLPAGPYVVQVDPDKWILRNLEQGSYGLNIVTTDLPPAPRDVAVDIPLKAKGGTPPYAWEFIDPAPPGIALDPATGHLHGAPALDGQFEFRVLVTDSAIPARTDAQVYAWTILPTPADTGDTAAAETWAGVHAAPNPAVRSVLLSFQDAGDGTSTWTVYDLAGRVVVVAESRRESDNGIRSWVWDGLDAGGHRAAPGVYFVRAGLAGRARSHGGRVLLLR